MHEEYLDNLPHSNEVWRGIGGHFDSLGQIIGEFIDNSIANLKAHTRPARNIAVGLYDDGHKIRVTIEDSGTGIANLSNAFRLGGKESQDSPLNEHGFGMKHALASANPENDDWRVCTRSHGDLGQGLFRRIEAGYQIQRQPVQVIGSAEGQWPGQFNGTGTFVEFATPRALFNTLRAGMAGQPAFGTIVGYLIEDLGFVYAGIIKRNEATFTVSWQSSGMSESKTVAAIEPDWEQYYNPPGAGVEDIDLGNGKVTLLYAFGAMKESTHRKYYKRNMSSSGLEVRLNGRVLEYNSFKAVWNRERHNMYNHFLVTLDLISDNRNRLPATRTSKNGLRQGDPLLENLYEWVRRKMPEPKKNIQEDPGERDLFEELANRKKTHVPDPKTVSTEQCVFTSLNERVRVDMYLSYGDSLILYEGKKDTTTVKDVYQLKMYWDGAAVDGLRPTQGVLLASRHPDSVTAMVNHINGMTDPTGRQYTFTTRLWQAEGIEYPG